MFYTLQRKRLYTLITIENEVKIIRNCLIINVVFIQNHIIWVYIPLLLYSLPLKMKLNDT